MLASEDKNKVKATYYIEPQLIKQLKLLAVERNTDLLALVSEAIRDLVGKAKGRRRITRWKVDFTRLHFYQGLQTQNGELDTERLKIDEPVKSQILIKSSS